MSYPYTDVARRGQSHLCVNTVVSRASAHGRSYFNVDIHRTGRLPCVLGAYPVYWVLTLCTGCLPCVLDAYPVYWELTLCIGRLTYVKIEVDGVNAYAHTFHIAHTITDGGCDRVWHTKLRRKGDSGRFNR